MNQVTIARISIIITIFVIGLTTSIVAALAHRTPAMKTWKATRPGVIFVVGIRRWTWIMIRTIGIIFAIIGVILFLSGLSGKGDTPLAETIAGGALFVVGLLFIWLAHGMARTRLEVTPDSIWVFRGIGAPRQVLLSEITKLKPIRQSNTYGGIVARSDAKTLFRATRIMIGYASLIEYFQTNRTDLTIPAESMPF